MEDGGSTSQRNENPLQFKHSIFLSHSGAQKSFVDQLCLDIERHDRYPFFDKRRDCLSVGCNFPKDIFKAIEQCQVAVVVLSEEFFIRSKWPMIELAAFVKRKGHDPKLVIMPVFLGLTHTECRDKVNQAHWMGVWERWTREESRIDLEDWKAALKVFGNTNGIHLNDVLGEVFCREEIVAAVCKEIPPWTRWDVSHVQGRSGLCMAIHAKIDGMQLSKSYGARILGIYGVGGIGKTTACKVLCNDYFAEFEGKVCHVEFGIGNKLLMLQEMLKRLSETNRGVLKNFSEDECKDRLKKDLTKKVFLAIDNVSNSQKIVDAAKDLLRMGFMEGSIVIVTARTCGQLGKLNLEDCMEMPELDAGDAKSLFLYHAAPGLYFKNGDEMNEQLLDRCIKQCYFGKGDGKSHHYHPLALKVLGGQLGNDLKAWIVKLDEVDPFNQYGEVDDEHPIYSILGRSFEILGREDQLLFMDAAIFLSERQSSYLYYQVNIFEWLSMVHGKSQHVIKRRVEGLKDKSLVENLGDGREEIGMHDLWREFAKGKSKGGELDSRFWFHEEIYAVNDPRKEDPNLSRQGGSESLQRMCMVGAKGECIVKEIDMSSFTKLEVLKLVRFNTDTNKLDLSSLRQLRSLEIVALGMSPNLSIDGLGCLRRLVFLRLDEIEVQSSSLQECLEGLTNLEGLHVEVVYSRAIFPDFSRLNSLRDVCFRSMGEWDRISGLSSKMTNLKRLDLSNCSMSRSCDGVGDLDLSGCSMLRSCDGVGDLEVLEKLNLRYCEMLEALPNLRRLKHLLELDISYCNLIEVVPGFGDLVSLQQFEGISCAKLAELPEMGKLINLQRLRVWECPSLKGMPGLRDLVALEELEVDSGGLEGCHDLRKLTKLERVRVRGWGAEGLPCLSGLVNVKILTIECAKELTGLDTLSSLQELHISWCITMDVRCLSNLTSLKSLRIYKCVKLERLPDMHRLSGLESLSIEFCERLREWESGSWLRLFGVDLYIDGTLPQLRTLTLDSVGFTELPDLSNFPQLRDLKISLCKKLTRLSSSAPLTALNRLELYYCGSLRALPDVRHLVSICSFSVKWCGELKLTALEIEKLESMCPGLKLDKSHLLDLNLENGGARDAKRLKCV